jgi:hypothetical protein
MNQKFNPRCWPGPQGRFLTSPIAALSEVFAFAYLSLLIADGLSALIPFIKRILITIFLMDQGSYGLGKTPRYRNNSWWCWSGLPQNSQRFVGGHRLLPKRVRRSWAGHGFSSAAQLGWGEPGPGVAGKAVHGGFVGWPLEHLHTFRWNHLNV